MVSAGACMEVSCVGGKDISKLYAFLLVAEGVRLMERLGLGINSRNWKEAMLENIDMMG